MATKRQAPYVQPSVQEQMLNEPERKRQKPNRLGKKSFKKAYPVNELKTQIRSLRRLLEHNDALPATVRVEKERALQSTQHELEQALRAKQRSEIISRYHKIRFFDRQKATKRLKKARTALRACGDDQKARDECARRVDEAEVDVNYAIYYPLEQPYVSLFPSRRKSQKSENGEGGQHDDESVERHAVEQERQADAEIWQLVKQCMEEGTLDALRNGKLVKPPASGDLDFRWRSIPVNPSKRKTVKDTAALEAGKNGQAKRDSDQESEGGFFE